MLITDHDFQSPCVAFVDGAYLGQGDGGEETDDLGQPLHLHHVGQL